MKTKKYYTRKNLFPNGFISSVVFFISSTAVIHCHIRLERILTPTLALTFAQVRFYQKRKIPVLYYTYILRFFVIALHLEY